MAKSLVRDLITEVNKTGTTSALLGQIESKAGITIEAGSIKVSIADEIDAAIVCYHDEPIGVLSVDYSEPCLIFKVLC